MTPTADPADSNAGSAVTEGRYNTLVVRWHKSIDTFDPVETLTAVAEDHQLRVRSAVAKKSGRFSLRIDTEASAKQGKRRKPQLVSREQAKAAAKLLRAALRDPRFAPTIADLAARSQAGEDVSADLLKVVSQEKSKSAEA